MQEGCSGEAKNILKDYYMKEKKKIRYAKKPSLEIHGHDDDETAQKRFIEEVF